MSRVIFISFCIKNLKKKERLESMTQNYLRKQIRVINALYRESFSYKDFAEYL